MSYPNLNFRNKFYLENIFAKGLFTKRKLMEGGVPKNKLEFYLEHIKSIVNLQLLEDISNIEKSMNSYIEN